MNVLAWCVVVWLFGVGIYGVVTSRHYVHMIGCLTVCQSATYVLLLGIGYRWGAGRRSSTTILPARPRSIR